MTDLPERPRLAAKARLSFDRHENRHVILYPEKGLLLSATSAAIVELCDGERRVADIVDALDATHPEGARADIERDVVSFLTDLRQRGLLGDAP